jgi:hypothetical protein
MRTEGNNLNFINFHLCLFLVICTHIIDLVIFLSLILFKIISSEIIDEHPDGFFLIRGTLNSFCRSWCSWRNQTENKHNYQFDYFQNITLTFFQNINMFDPAEEVLFVPEMHYKY